MTKATNIVHEADAQRQHVRVQLPALIEMDGKIFKVTDWSNAGVSVLIENKEDQTWLDAQKFVESVLIFDFDSFSLKIPMTIEPRHIDTKDNLVGMRFTNMTERQISIMQHLVGSYVSGELTEVNELIHVIGRNNMSSPRKIPSKSGDVPFSEKIRQFVRKGAVALVSVALVAYVSMSIYEDAFIVSANSATVTADNFTITAPSQGVVSYKAIDNGDTVSKGEALISVLSKTGTLTSADSPCDCIVVDRMVRKGSYVDSGKAVLNLVQQDADFYVEANIEYDNALKISKSDRAVIALGDGDLDMVAKIDSITVKKDQANTAIVKLITEKPLPQDSYGMPVDIKIDTAGWLFR